MWWHRGCSTRGQEVNDMNTTSGLMYVLSTVLAFFSYNIAADVAEAFQGELIVETVVYAPAFAEVIPFRRASPRGREVAERVAA